MQLTEIEINEDWHGYKLEIFYNPKTDQWMLKNKGDDKGDDQFLGLFCHAELVDVFGELIIGIMKYVRGTEGD